MSVDPILRRLRDSAAPPTDARERVWNRVQHAIQAPDAVSGMQQLRDWLQPHPAVRARLATRLLPRLVPTHVSSSYRTTKWVAAFAVVMVVLRLSPVLLLAPQTSADSSVILVPTKGAIEMLSHGLWQPISEEVELQQGSRLRTVDSEATILLHDDGTIRLAPHTSISLLDITDRPAQGALPVAVQLHEGRVWVQGLLPAHVRGITVESLPLQVTVNGGSVSMEKSEDTVLVYAWDRRAVVQSGDDRIVLVVGERLALENGKAIVRRSDAALLEDAWVTQNLQRDAVHQREIAQMQRERKAAQAGILPTSPLYPVKRMAERVDVLLTIDPDAKAQKKVQQASTRLSEAVALITDGQEGDSLIDEYRDTLLAVASSGTGSAGLSRFLVQQEVEENAAELAAALPDDVLYSLKRAVLETTADVSPDSVDIAEVRNILLTDSLDVLRKQIADGQMELALHTYEELQPDIEKLEQGDDETIEPDLRKEIATALRDAAQLLADAEPSGTGAMLLVENLQPYLPPRPTPSRVALSEEQVDAIVAGIRERIFVYTQSRPRWNQLQIELQELQGHPDEGTILRHLYHALPRDGLARYVRTAIQQLRERTQGE